MSNKFSLNIVFYVNGMPFTGDSLDRHSLGGSETAGLCMARELAKRGHSVTVFSNLNGEPKNYDGVKYMPIDMYMKYMKYTPVDVLVAQRVPWAVSAPFKSKVNILWQHDLATKAKRSEFINSLWNVDKIMGVSDYHTKQMAEVYKVDENAFVATKNGIDKINIKKSQKRQKKRLFYSARPERGLEVLLNKIMPLIWEQDKDVELFVAGYDNVAPQMANYYNMLKGKMAEYKSQGFKVEDLGCLTKKDLYNHMQKASLYVYPTEFEEVSCITAMECMGNGLPFVSTGAGALQETLGEDYMSAVGTLRWKMQSDEAFLTDKAEIYSDEVIQQQFADHVLDLLDNDVMRKRVSTLGLKRVKHRYTWEGIAGEWEEMFMDLIKDKVTDFNTMATHFYRMEDIMALKELVKREDHRLGNLSDAELKDGDEEALFKWVDVLADQYKLIDDEEAYRKLYVEYAERFKAKFDNGELKLQINKYERVHLLMENFLKPYAMQKKTDISILDYGCAVGNEAIQFVNEIEGCKVTAVNIAQGEIEVAKQSAEKFCEKPENIKWITGDDVKGLMPDASMGNNHNVVWAGEILEHVKDPVELINSLEDRCEEGGVMAFTVPLGSWGDVPEATLEERGHLWSFDTADLRDLFGDKKNFTMIVVEGGNNGHNGESLGWFLITYKKDSSKKTGTIDMDRKLAMQAPRDTVSACMIVGGKQEGLLHRCLDSIYNYVDEIVISDCGMSKESLNIVKCDKYKNKVVLRENAPNPLEVGFDEARNFSIDGVRGDWILWIDSDEELLTGFNLMKYLRKNPYEGYAIRQHHFSAQPSVLIKPDLPVRLFRNKKNIKFFGVVHEHPEKVLNEGIGMAIPISDVDLAHDGFLTEHGRKGRFSRNIGLMHKDRDKYPDRKLGRFLMIRDNMQMARYRWLEMGQFVDAEVARLCEEVIVEYREGFIKDSTHMAVDGLGFYSEALCILGRGMDYNTEIMLSQPQSGNTNELPSVRARFENREDFMTFIEHQLQMACEQYEGKYVI